MIRKAEISDIPILSEMFWSNISRHTEYISHGEIQMGVASDENRLAPDGQKKWERYIEEKIDSSEDNVLIYLSNRKPSGFIVVSIESDGDRPFGVICDVVVNPQARGRGLGKNLLEEGIKWLRSRDITDIYLESGIHNHNAHAFFEKFGFKQISHIFKMNEN